MRKIIFRGKRVDNGEWVCSGNLIHFNEDDQHFIANLNEKCISTHDENDHIIAIEDTRIYKVIPETVGQYTGLTDKNGKKIFEGDIVEKKFDERICGCYAVNMNKERGGWFPFACGDGCGCCEDEVVKVEYCEVIGNIHDNPELLKEG